MASANLDFTQKVRFKQLHEEEDEDPQLSPSATDEGEDCAPYPS